MSFVAGSHITLSIFMVHIINHVIELIAVTLESYCIHGYHIYCWDSKNYCMTKFTNKQDGYAFATYVAVIKDGIVIGHLL